MTAIKAYVINLDRNPDRMQATAETFDRLGVNYHRFAAFDGSKLPQEEFDAFVKARPRNGKSWNRGQAGCFMSQFTLWELAANSPDPYTAIFEDDMYFSDTVADFLKDDSWVPKNCDIVRFETSTTRLLLDDAPMTTHAARGVYKVNSTSWCAGGYVLSRESAKRVIAVPPERHNTADHYLFVHEQPVIAKDLTIAQVVPALCIQDKFFHADARNAKYVSEIVTNHEGTTIQARLRYLFKRSPLTFLIKTLKGYKRVPYAA